MLSALYGSGTMNSPPRFDGVSGEGLSYVAASFVEFLERVPEDWSTSWRMTAPGTICLADTASLLPPPKHHPVRQDKVYQRADRYRRQICLEKPDPQGTGQQRH